jgi:8-oxo-dGTP diphosphatase
VLCENWTGADAWRWIGYNPDMDQTGMLYTLIFLTRGEQVLMLHRRNPPNQGLWNGIGGRIEAGETPLACALREVREESGYHLERLHFAGTLTWDGFETPPGGLYLFTAEAPSGDARGNGEGELAWKSKAWVFSALEVVSNILVFGPNILNGAQPKEYYFNYREGKIAGYEIREIPPDYLREYER